MKNYVKHSICLSIVAFLLAIASCKKDSGRQSELVVDFRDSITGTYIGPKHSYQAMGPNGWDSVVGMDTLFITKSGVDSDVIVNGSQLFNIIYGMDSVNIKYRGGNTSFSSYDLLQFSHHNQFWSVKYYFDGNGSVTHPGGSYCIADKI